MGTDHERQTLFLDCFSGASGDMLLGALLDVGAPLEAIEAGLRSLPLDGWTIQAVADARGTVRGTHARVRVSEQVQPRRGLRDVLAILAAGGLPSTVQETASTVFRRLAEVEARIHGESVDEVHFHEVGAIDAIVDVVGVLLALDFLNVDRGQVFATGLPLGFGWVQTEHGLLPVPAPATAALLAESGAPTRPTPPSETPSGELTTPTGAALLSCLATFQEPTFARIERVGYGLGSRTLPWPNALRAWLGLVAKPAPAQRDVVAQLETNLDDSTPEQLGFAMEQLLEAGALDVAFVPLQMKKNRPGVIVRVLTSPAQAEEMALLLMRHTSALGVRVERIERVVAERRQRTVRTPWGEVRVKEKLLGGQTIAAPEYEDCAARAREAGVPLTLVYEAAVHASRPPELTD